MSKMEPKKKNLLENLRLKLPHKKKPGKKPLKQGKKLAYRRSISVPDLSLVRGDPSPDGKDHGLLTSTSDAIFFAASSGQSDTDSIASGSFASGPVLSDRLALTDFGRGIRQKVSAHVDTSPYRMSSPAEVMTLYEEGKDKKISSSSEKVSFSYDVWDSPIDQPAKTVGRGNLTVITAPVPTPRSYTAQSPLRPTLSADGINPYTNRLNATDQNTTDTVSTASGGAAAALARVTSFGDQPNFMEKQAKKPPSGKWTPPAIRTNTSADRWSQLTDTGGAQAESADGTSLDSACGTPLDEGIPPLWATDSEDQEREHFTPMLSDIFTMDEAQLEASQLECFQEDIVEAVLAEPEAPPCISIQRYLLTINLKEGKNLVIRDKRSGTSDPYVKFKLEGKQFYKSKVMYKNLNPRWNESFSHPLRDRSHAVEVRVYDKNRTADEFMGSSSIVLQNLELYKTCPMELHLADPKSRENDMGVIVVEVCLMFRDATIKRPIFPKKNKGGQQQNPGQGQSHKIQRKNQVWRGVYNISLVEGQDLPKYGGGDVYVRFRLGDQKYKSKNLCIQANPQWREQFDFNQFEDNQEPLQVEVCSKRGRKSEESWGMYDIDLSKLPIKETQLYSNVLNPGKGRLLFLVTLSPCWGVSICDIQAAPLDQPDEKDSIVEKFSLKNSHKSVREVGFLQVKVIKATDVPAADLPGKSDPFCVIELGNSRLQTQTIYKTLNPEWNQVFTLPIKDIHDVLELTVLGENGDKSAIFLGKVAIPLLTIKNGQQRCFFLKKEDLGRPSKGSVTLILDIVYNKIRAGVKTFQPKEIKFTEENLKFSKKVLAQNIYRVRKISTAVLYTLQYIKSCFQWESTQRSLIAFLIFLLTVWSFELFMIPLFLLLLIGWNYFQLTSGKNASNQDLVNMNMADDEEEDEKESGKKSLMAKIHMVQEIVITVQNILDEVANIGERIKNTVNWSVPFLSCLACLVLFLATTLLYYIPLRYILLIWGVNKFTKKLRNPHAIDNNEILDFLKRVPSDVQKVQYSEPRAPGVQSPPRRRR